MATVRKRGNSYQIRVSCGYDLNGNQVEQYMTWKPDKNMTEKQIEKELNRQVVKFEEECEHGQIVTTKKFSEFAETWFNDYAKLNLRKTTYARVEYLRERTDNAIGHLRMDKITSRDIQKFINSLAADGVNERTGGGLSHKTIKHYLSYISTIFDFAIKMQMLQNNPCRNVTVPKGEPKEREFYTIEEVERLSELLQDAPMKYRVFFNLAIYSGFRRSELLGLEWKDIDFDEGLVHIRRTSNYVAGEGMYTDTTKTKKSQRVIKLPPVMLDLLKEYKAEQHDQSVEIGSKWVETDRLFTTWDGKPINGTVPYNWLKRFCRNNNMRFCNIHSLRHFHTSVLISSGVDVTTVSNQLGHSNSNTTLGIYSHMFAEARTKTCDVITNALDFNKKESKNRTNS